MKPVSKIENILQENGIDLEQIEKIYPTGIVRMKSGLKISYKKLLKHIEPVEVKKRFLDDEQFIEVVEIVPEENKKKKKSKL